MSRGEILLGFLGLLLTIGVGVMGLRLKPLEDKDAVNEKAIDAETKAREKALEAQAELYDRRIDALHSDKKDLERRLGEVEKNALTRAEMDAVRRDMAANIEKVGDRMVAAMEHLTERVDDALKRVAQVEASRG